MGCEKSTFLRHKDATLVLCNVCIFNDNTEIHIRGTLTDYLAVHLLLSKYLIEILHYLARYLVHLFRITHNPKYVDPNFGGLVPLP